MGETMTNLINEMSSGARGVVFIHSAAKALTVHIEWTLGRLLGATVHLDWIDQPVVPGAVRTELAWVGTPDLSTEIASTLRAYPNLRFEVTEEPSAGFDGQRFVSTPSLGLWRSPMGAFGQTYVSEEKLRSAVAAAVANGTSLLEVINEALGNAWDLELEPFRFAGEGVPVRWLHQVS